MLALLNPSPANITVPNRRVARVSGSGTLVVDRRRSRIFKLPSESSHASIVCLQYKYRPVRGFIFLVVTNECVTEKLYCRQSIDMG